MLQSRALGGPRDGVKLTAGPSWNGRVETPQSTPKAPKYYGGRYVWDWDFQAWIWHADKPKVKAEEKAGTPHAW